MDETDTEVTGCRIDCSERLVAVTAMAVAGKFEHELATVLGVLAALVNNAFK